MTAPQLRDATQVDPERLDAFLRTVYTPERCDFLKRHGDWWHQSGANRLVIEVGGRIAGYCAVIPARVSAAGQVRSALWWVDLVIAADFRGQGLQSLFDRRVREMSDLLLGFPNELAAKIHRKHGWGVRDDLVVLLLPLRPAHVKPLQQVRGLRGFLLRAGSWAAEPAAFAWRAWLKRQKAGNARKLAAPDPVQLGDIFERTRSAGQQTTWRDAAYFAWRYGAAPVPTEYTWYLAGPDDRPTHFLAARHLTQANGLRYTRILDVFGDLDDVARLRDLMILALQDAIAHRSGQVTLLTSSRAITGIARRLGFIITAPVSFCWTSESAEIMGSFSGDVYWTLSDSDNDAPD